MHCYVKTQTALTTVMILTRSMLLLYLLLNYPLTVAYLPPLLSNKGYIVPGWNEYVKEHYLHAKDALKWWNLNNRPRYGPIYDIMRTIKAPFKYGLRFAKIRKKLQKLMP